MSNIHKKGISKRGIFTTKNVSCEMSFTFKPSVFTAGDKIPL